MAVPPTRVTDGGARPLEPRLLGRYRLISEQGAGLFGAVWLAEEVATGQPVALRLFPRELTDTANVAEMIRRRARAVVEASRAHPGLVRVLEYGTTDDGRLFAVMERLEGGRLSEMLASRQRFDVPAALRLAIEMGGPVETLHNMGLVHGALRPTNFVVADGRVMLMDVETIALRDAPALQHLVAAQSPAAYLAPEQIQGRPITEKTDVYAFALTLYEMLTGRPPFAATTRDALLDKHLKDPPLPPRYQRRAIPLAIETTIMEGLDKRPEVRPFMPKVLNHIATEAGTGVARWKRPAAIAAGVVAVVAMSAPIAWSVLGPRLSPPAVLAPAPEETPVEPNADPATATMAAPPSAEPAASAPGDPLPPAIGAPPAIEAPPPVAAAPPVVALPPTAVTPPAAAVPRPAASPPAVVAPPAVVKPPSVTVPPAAVAPPPAVSPPPAALPPPIAAPPTITPPPAPRAAAPRPPQVAPAPRVEPPRPTPPAVAPAPARPAPSPGADEPDPTAVIDWLLKRRGE